MLLLNEYKSGKRVIIFLVVILVVIFGYGLRRLGEGGSHGFGGNRLEVLVEGVRRSGGKIFNEERKEDLLREGVEGLVGVGKEGKLFSERKDFSVVERSKRGFVSGVLDESVGGEAILAEVELEGKKLTLYPNSDGNFDRIYVKASQKIPVVVTYPFGEFNEEVVIETKDGGGLRDGVAAEVGRLDSEGRFVFTFSASEYDGTHRVVVRKGGDLKAFDFWVGKEIPFAEN